MAHQYKHLEWSDRRIIEKLRISGHSLRHIASVLGVSTSTVSRELLRNSNDHIYNSHTAQESSEHRRAKANGLRRKLGKTHLDFIRSQLELTLSPEQIASLFPGKFGFKVSTKTIYLTIYRFDKEKPSASAPLNSYLRLRNTINRRKWRLISVAEFKRPHISQRPAAAEQRSEYGHWEMDLFVGPRNLGACALVMVDRKSRYSLICPLQNRKSSTINKALKNLISGYMVRSITTDNGLEFIDHKTISQTTQAPIFYCNPYCSWEKGTVENTIGLYRYFFPKGQPLRTASMPYKIAQLLINSRPRKILQFKTPASYLDKITLKL